MFVLKIINFKYYQLLSIHLILTIYSIVINAKKFNNAVKKLKLAIVNSVIMMFVFLVVERLKP
jgi:hypothetical protein